MKKTEIKPDKRNYNKHSDENKRVINKSLNELGGGRSILLDSENEIIAGNGVYEQAEKLNIPVRIIETDGSELIAVKRTDLKTDDEKRKKLALVDNTANSLSSLNNNLVQEDFNKDMLDDWGIKLEEGYFQKDQKNKQEFIEEKVPYPITIVVSKADYDKWIALKREINEENDLKAFIKVLKHVV